MPWKSSVDIWAAGIMVWSMFERRPIFDISDLSFEDTRALYLAQMTGILGPPPVDFVTEHEACRRYWDETGAWKGVEGIEIPAVAFQEMVTCFTGNEAAQFVDFMRSMLRWKPEERYTARQLLTHPFLRNEPRRIDGGHSEGVKAAGMEVENQGEAGPGCGRRGS